ncbi:Sodium/hydrogen exchanger 9 [Bulinus truncatus]|nr:Sodium/hydrogen exchanger 9 [Bulinus truncatus]
MPGTNNHHRQNHKEGWSGIPGHGLIVGAIVRYTSDPKHIPTAPAALLGNESYTSLSPPDLISIILSRSNSSDAPTDRLIYAFKGAIAALEEPPLERAVTFSPELFFNVMLPVIIFNAGYSMKRKHFFKNLGAILMFALIGTTVSALVVGAIMYGLTRLMRDITISLNECFIFGAYLSATDPVTVLALFNDLHVDVDLYALVFGESVLNDAVAIVLSESVETYGEYSTDAFSLEAFFSALGKFAGVMAGAFAIGTTMGIITAFLFELMNFLSENFVFLYIGVSIFTFEPHKWHAGFIFAAFFAVIIARFFNVYPLSFLLNLGRSNKIRPNFQHMMMFSGLRGAMAFALAIRETDSEGKQLMASATMIIVLATVILCGGFTTPMLQWLQIRVGVDESETEMQHMAGESVRNRPTNNTTPIGLPSATSPRVTEKAWLVAKWYNFDMRFMKPLLTNCRPTLMETLPSCCMPFAKLFTTEEQISQGEIHIDDDSEIDMIIDQGNTSQDGEYNMGSEAGGHGDSNNPTAQHISSSHWGPKDNQYEQKFSSFSSDE